MDVFLMYTTPPNSLHCESSVPIWLDRNQVCDNVSILNSYYALILSLKSTTYVRPTEVRLRLMNINRPFGVWALRRDWTVTEYAQTVGIDGNTNWSVWLWILLYMGVFSSWSHQSHYWPQYKTCMTWAPVWLQKWPPNSIFLGSSSDSINKVSIPKDR